MCGTACAVLSGVKPVPGQREVEGGTEGLRPEKVRANSNRPSGTRWEMDLPRSRGKLVGAGWAGRHRQRWGQ